MATTGRSTKRAGDDLDAMSRRVVETISSVSAEAGDRIADAAGGAEQVVRKADASLRKSSDQTLGMVGALSVGLAVGLLIGGSNRLLIAAALIPAALVAGVALERIDREARAPRRQPS